MRTESHPAALRPAFAPATPRQVALVDWLLGMGLDPTQLETVPGDASLRHYYRLGNPSLVIMDAPPGVEDTLPFLRMAWRLRRIGLHAPRVLAADTQQGFLMLEDLGRSDLKHVLDEGQDAVAWYQAAIQAIVVMQAGDSRQPASSQLPAFDAARLRTELDLFPDWYLGKHLRRELNGHEQRLLDATFELLIDNALAQPQVLVHRDYHARNLMCLPRQEIGILDFQDAVTGPITYDLASLLLDRYWDWPDDWLEARVDDYLALAREAGLPVGDDAQFRVWLRRMGLQRNLKIVGIFARLCHRDGKQGYVEMIPRFWSYVLKASAQDPALQSFHAWLLAISEDGGARQ